MKIPEHPFSQFRAKANTDFTLVELKILVITWALFIIALAIVSESKLFLAGVLAYEVLP